MEGAQWSIPPLRESISSPRSVNDLFSHQTAKKELVLAIGNLIKDYPQYRKIRGDGNCFYRAVAFNWMRDCDLTKFDEVFPAFGHIQLALCKPQTVPEQFPGKYNQTYIKNSFRKGWERLFGKGVKDREDSLVAALNKYLWLDFMVVNYFRCLNHHTIQYNKDFYKTYSPKSVTSQLARIVSYGEEAEGVEIQAMAYSLNSEIQIYMVTKQAIYPIVYPVRGKTSTQSLLFRPGHYDTLCPRSYATGNRTSKVHFKQKVDIVTDVVNARSHQSGVSPPSKILKKTTTKWRPPRITEEETAKSFDTVDWLLKSISKERLLQLVLLLAIAVLTICCFYKHQSKGGRVAESRSYWSWRQEYLQEHRSIKQNL